MRNIITNLMGNSPLVRGVDLWVELGPILVVVVAWFGLIVLGVFLLRRISYRVGSKRFMVTLLGIPIRWVRLDNIRGIHPRHVRFSEKWHNTIFNKNDRILVIQKKRGLLKHLEITPEQRFVFKAELDRAIRLHLGLPPGPSASDTTIFDQIQIPSAPEPELEPSVTAHPPSSIVPRQ